MLDKPRIGILGPGAVGGFLAAMFDKAGFEVICVAKESSAKLITEQGVRIESGRFGDWVARPQAVSFLETPVDVLFLTPKAIHLADAVERLDKRAVENALLVPILNGYEHMAFLRERFASRLAAGVIRIEAKYLSANHFAHTSDFSEIQWASQDVSQDHLLALAAVLSTSQVDFTTMDDEIKVLFGKLVRLNAVASTTAAFNQPIGTIVSDMAYRPTLEGVVEEGVAVANAAYHLGYKAQDVLTFIEGLHPTQGTSLQRDLYSGKPIELDAITGALLRLARRYDIACPTMSRLYDMITAIHQQQITCEAVL